MSPFARSEIELHDTSMATTEDGEGITIRIAGNADSRVKDRLQELLLQAHAEARSRHLPRISVDLRALEFMSSSCFKAFVSWLAEVRQLEPDEQYSIHFVSDPQVHWQRRSLHALSCFAAELVHIEH